MAQERSRRMLTVEALQDIESRIVKGSFGDHQVRAIWEEGQYWIVLADVLNAIGYQVKASHIAKDLKDDQISYRDIGAKNTLVNCITTSGLYMVTRFSGKPKSGELYNWCINSFLPAAMQCRPDDLEEQIANCIKNLSCSQKNDVLNFINTIQSTKEGGKP